MDQSYEFLHDFYDENWILEIIHKYIRGFRCSLSLLFIHSNLRYFPLDFIRNGTYSNECLWRLNNKNGRKKKVNTKLNKLLKKVQQKKKWELQTAFTCQMKKAKSGRRKTMRNETEKGCDGRRLWTKREERKRGRKERERGKKNDFMNKQAEESLRKMSR